MGVATFRDDGTYRKAADEARDTGNAWPPNSPEANHYKTGWDHAVHKGARGERKHPAHVKGVVHGLMWRRKNSRS